MNKIEVKILNHSAVKEAEKHMVFAARLTQRGQKIHSMEDLMTLYDQSFFYGNCKKHRKTATPDRTEIFLENRDLF